MIRNFSFLFLIFIFCAFFLQNIPARAAAIDIPSTAEPARVQNQFSTSHTRPNAVLAAPEVEGQSAANIPDGASDITFILSGILIDGMTVYKGAEVTSLFQDKLNTEISLADIFKLAADMTSKYRNDGYILSQVIVPPQTVDDGKIHLTVIEGFVDQVSFQGGVHDDIAVLEGYGEKIKAERPLRADTLERYTLLMNDIPGLTAQAVLSPSTALSGASNLIFMLEQKTIDVFTQIDNRGSRYIGAGQMNTGVQINNFLGFHESLSFQFATAPDGWPDREMDHASFTWTQPINHRGTTLAFNGSVTSTRPGYDLDFFGIHGVARSFSLRANHPIIRTRTENLFCNASFEMLQSKRKDIFGASDIDDSLRVLRAGINWERASQFVAPALNTLNLEVSQGLDIFNASKKGDASLTRALGDPTFTKASFTATRSQAVTEKSEVFIALTGQRSLNTLLSSEEFGVGGASFGSAYDSSEITGEDGLAARIEMRLNNPTDKIPLPALQLYGFYDIGKVWDRDNATRKDRVRSLASAGLGARMSISNNISGTAEMAAPLTRLPGTQKDKDPRFFISLSVQF